MEPRHDDPVTAEHAMEWRRALVAGLVATGVITVTMALSGQNVMKMLGDMTAPGASAGTQYAIGGAMHLTVGLIYGFLYAWLLGPVRRRGRAVKGVLYGAALAGIALAVTPAASAIMGGGAANPCGGKAAANPCHGPMAAAGNPCHPQSAANPCHGKSSAGNPCGGGAGNPCGGGGGSMAGLLSLLNHIVYALTLALVYGTRRS